MRELLGGYVQDGSSLRSVSSHFAFGENWKAFARNIDAEKIGAAEAGLLALVDRQQLAGASFADIGCGSGLHALAALNLGAAKVYATDIDPVSVETARAVLRGHGDKAKIENVSVFDLSGDTHGQFDIVYFWGVLHHTGDMAAAIRAAASLVTPGGLFVLALYRRTRLDRPWTAEKRWYARTSPSKQAMARRTYDYALRLASLATGKWPRFEDRGMEYWTNVHDWLGGYPYETILAPEFDVMLTGLGFRTEKTIARPLSWGLFGSGCDEYVYRSMVQGAATLRPAEN
jgi:2-polyprenyl-6-hydroxyphenyl methylase/3-demethylubiquinone-9 3-methyltransferase